MRKESSTKTVQSFLSPDQQLIVPEYMPQLSFKTKLDVATDKIKAYRAFFYDKAERSDSVVSPTFREGESFT